ncbi:hypothetical protein QAD02_002745 [Eretmocerus hayati]|uniref:Uncharacterized protein n=1 Tax=Eretmocerus hayati TaxID=131215 RepID=A0ACC2NLH3_9HYME|nr:hypothetical protein QAD02_002745 [Eretmocerus hayati]
MPTTNLTDDERFQVLINLGFTPGCTVCEAEYFPNAEFGCNCSSPQFDLHFTNGQVTVTDSEVDFLAHILDEEDFDYLSRYTTWLPELVSRDPHVRHDNFERCRIYPMTTYGLFTRDFYEAEIIGSESDIDTVEFPNLEVKLSHS